MKNRCSRTMQPLPVTKSNMGIKDELSGYDRELSMFPVRAFDFKNAGTVVIEQDVADVGSVVWDAEVILAHFLDVKYGFELRGKRVLELGAGTGLAGIVAARLGASVVLTDQAKILPTLIKNARGNAAELEHCAVEEKQETIKRPPQKDQTEKADDALAAAPIAETDPASKQPLSSRLYSTKIQPDQRASTTVESLLEHTSSCRAAGMPHHDVSKSISLSLSTGLNTDDSGDRRTSKGSWRVEELLFTETQDDLMASLKKLGDEWLVEKGGGLDCSPGHAEEGEVFDLVVAADIVYLRDLWDAMAFTFKALLSPTGTAFMIFEQRRGNVEVFFGPPRFGGGHLPGNRQSPSEVVSHSAAKKDGGSDSPEDGEHDGCESVGGRGMCAIARELQIRDEIGIELGDAAATANVRLFRMCRG